MQDPGTSTLLKKVDISAYDQDGHAIDATVESQGDTLHIDHPVYDLLDDLISGQTDVLYHNGKQYAHKTVTDSYSLVGQLLSRQRDYLQNGVRHIWKESYQYNQEGKLELTIRNDGSHITDTYTPNGQLATITLPSGKTIKHIYNANGKLISLTGANGQIMHSRYYLGGMIKTITYPDHRTLQYVYDQFNRLTSKTNPAGGTTDYTYYQKGPYHYLPQTVSYAGKTLTYQYGKQNGVNGGLISTALSSNGIAIIHTYQMNGFGKMNDDKVTNAQGIVLLDTQYHYTPKGQLQTMSTRSVQAHSSNSINAINTYRYDGLSQTSEVKTLYHGGLTQHQPDDIVYTYDGNHNVLTQTENGKTTKYQYNALDQLTDINGHSVGQYDPLGNMKQDAQGRTYIYNEQNELTEVKDNTGQVLVTYTYYPDGLLASRNDNELFYYENGTVDAISSQGKWNTFFMANGQRLIAINQASSGKGNALYYLSSNNSTSATMQQDGTITGHSYTSYGQVKNVDTGSISKPLSSTKSFMWDQEYSDPATGLTYLRARFYNPALMRFMSMDSYAVANKYGFVQGDPINKIDPSGHMSKGSKISMGIVMGATAFVGLVAIAVTWGGATPEVAAAEGAEESGASAGEGAAGFIARRGGGAVIAKKLAIGTVIGAGLGAAQTMIQESIDDGKFTAGKVGLSALFGAGAGLVTAGIGVAIAPQLKAGLAFIRSWLISSQEEAVISDAEADTVATTVDSIDARPPIDYAKVDAELLDRFPPSAQDQKILSASTRYYEERFHYYASRFSEALARRQSLAEAITRMTPNMISDGNEMADQLGIDENLPDVTRAKISMVHFAAREDVEDVFGNQLRERAEAGPEDGSHLNEQNHFIYYFRALPRLMWRRNMKVLMELYPKRFWY